MLLDSLSAILEQLVPGHTRLVVFNLAQDRVLLKESSRIVRPRRGGGDLSGLQFGVIDYQTLQNQPCVSDLLSTLLQQELRRAEQPDALIWLGPISDAQTRLQMQRLESSPPSKASIRSTGSRCVLVRGCMRDRPNSGLRCQAASDWTAVWRPV